MARRMFSQRITNSGKFLQMSTGAQALYFHLGMAADDDGIVDAITVLRTTNAQEDDFRVLVAKNLIRPLNEEMITFILDWKEHNLLRADRITPSLYRGLLVQVMPELELIEPKKRADVVGHLKPGRPVDALSKDKISKDNNTVANAPIVISIEGEESPKAPKAEPMVKKCAEYWLKKCQEEVGAVPTGGLSKAMWKIKEVRKHLEFSQIKQMIDEWFQTQSLDEADMIQITRCLSSYQIDKFKRENV